MIEKEGSSAVCGLGNLSKAKEHTKWKGLTKGNKEVERTHQGREEGDRGPGQGKKMLGGGLIEIIAI